MSNSPDLFNDGESYERLMGRWSRRVGVEFIAWLAAPKHQDWLDAGCGNGAFTEEIFAHGDPKLVTAVDPAEAQIAFARSRSGTKRAQFSVGDAQNLNLPSNSFDVAAMALVIAFIPDAAKALSELARVTKPGGVVSTYMWDLLGGGFPLRPVYGALKAMGHPAPLPPNPEASRLADMRTLWEGAGLEDVETTTFRIQIEFKDFNDFWITNTIPIGPQGKFVEDLPAATKEQLRQSLQAHLKTKPDGSIQYEAWANAVKGRKPQA